jgi:hypothetical protein
MSKKLVCTQCGYVGKPKGAIKGNTLIEIILWLFLIIPGLIYSIWRSSSRYKICPQCKSSTLIPVDSPRAKKIMSESMTSEEILKIEQSEADTEFKSRYLRWLNYYKKHILATIIILLIGTPVLLGMISGILDTDKPKQPSTELLSTQTTPTLTERLTKILNDPYWTSTTPGDYSDRTKIQVQSIVFSTYANDVAEGEKSASREDQRLASELKEKLVSKQTQEYPKMRKAYFEFVRNISKEKNVEVTLSGLGNTTLTLTGAIFGSTEAINIIQDSIKDMAKELRFKGVYYKALNQGKSQHFDFDTLGDDELETISI